MKKYFGLFLLFLMGLMTCQAAAQKEFISYNLDGKSFCFSCVKLVWHTENYIDIEGIHCERIDLGINSIPRYREAEASITFQISPNEGSFVSTYKGHSSDTLPIYVNWYEVKNNNDFIVVNTMQADMDSDGGVGQFFTVTIENFGDEGTLIKGSFSGRMLDADGAFHSIDSGRFALRRRNE